MKRPAFQFYPGDWQRNANLRRCSPAARGVWVDVMCMLHDSDEYGVLRWPLKDIAQAAGASMAHVRELVEKAVLKGSDKRVDEAYVYTPRSGRKDGEPVILIPTQAGPIWYSSRMVKDEYVRTIRGESSRFGEHMGDAPKPAPKPPFGDGSTSASTTAVIYSEANASGGKPPSPPPAPAPKKEKTPAEQERSRLWALLKTALVEEKICTDVKAAGTLLGKQASKYGTEVFVEACRETLAEPRVGTYAYLIALCDTAAGRRTPLNRTPAAPKHSGAAAAIYDGADHV